jgi:uncharacterized tellurite resistance protein B-like protein
MIWGHPGNDQNASAIANSVASFVDRGYEHVLGFNEPDNSTQATLPVGTALALWPSGDGSLAVGRGLRRGARHQVAPRGREQTPPPHRSERSGGVDAIVRPMTDESPMSTKRDVFELEVVKLLLQVAWADHDVAPEEAEAVMQRAREIPLSETHVQEFATYLRGEAPLPPPNLGLLRTRRAEVLKHVKRMLEADLHVADEESEILEQISTLLGG